MNKKMLTNNFDVRKIVMDKFKYLRLNIQII